MKLFTLFALSTLPFIATAQIWTQKSDFPGAARDAMVSFTINDIAYSGLGDTANNQYVTDFYKYNPSTDTWTAIAPFPGPGRERAVAFSAGGKGYVGLGDDLNTFGQLFKDFYAYDPQTDAWTQIPDFPNTGRSDAIAFGINDFGYVGFGYDTIGSKKDFYRYRPMLNNWQTLGDATIEDRWGAASFVIGDKAYVVGGVKGSNFFLSDIQEYNPATLTWTEKIFASSSLQFIRAKAFAVNNKAYICYGNQNYVAQYDLATNQVSNLGDVVGNGESRVQPLTFSVGNRGYFGLGYAIGGNSGFRKDVWQYSPVSAVTDQELPKADVQVLYTNNHNAFEIKLSQTISGQCSIQVFNINGAVCVKLENIYDGQLLNLEDFPSGPYFVRFSTKVGERTEKIIVGN